MYLCTNIRINRSIVMTSKVEYKGSLRTECTHFKSGNSILTDAPIDNHGKGETFSPTDLVATGLSACMLTVVGIYCDNHNIPFDNATSEVKKIMASHPRRISEIEILLDFRSCNFEANLHQRIKNVVETCPVQNSIHPDIQVRIDYKF